jgi:hypothetical protein
VIVNLSPVEICSCSWVCFFRVFLCVDDGSRTRKSFRMMNKSRCHSNDFHGNRKNVTVFFFQHEFSSCATNRLEEVRPLFFFFSNLHFICVPLERQLPHLFFSRFQHLSARPVHFTITTNHNRYHSIPRRRNYELVRQRPHVVGFERRYPSVLMARHPFT